MLILKNILYLFTQFLHISKICKVYTILVQTTMNSNVTILVQIKISSTYTILVQMTIKVESPTIKNCVK